MEFKMIEALRYAAQGCTGTLEPEWVTLKEAAENFERLFSLLEQFGINAQNMTPELEDAINLVSINYERQGFITGFRMGVQLMRECTCQVTGGEAV